VNRDISLDQVPATIREPVRDLAHLVLRLAGDNLRGLVVFGPVVAPDCPRADEPIRTVVILGGMDLLLLDQIRRSGRRLGRRRLHPPLIMTPRYIDESLDTFPLELLEIQQLHVRVVGPDLLADLRFDPRNMRLQAERELKRSLIHLRQGLLASAGKDTALRPLCREAFDHLLRVLRGLLWLKATPCPTHPLAILEATERLTQMNLAGLRDAWDSRVRGDFVWFQRFYRDVERLSDYVNALAV